jgi:hypothetical protein
MTVPPAGVLMSVWLTASGVDRHDVSSLTTIG